MRVSSKVGTFVGGEALEAAVNALGSWRSGEDASTGFAVSLECASISSAPSAKV